MDQYRSRLKLSENFERHWSIRISGEIHMDQSLVHNFFGGNEYGPMVLKDLLKFPPTLALVHGCALTRKKRKKHPLTQAVLDGVPPTGVATLEVRKGDFNALNKGTGSAWKSEVKLSPPGGRHLKNSMTDTKALQKQLPDFLGAKKSVT